MMAATKTTGSDSRLREKDDSDISATVTVTAGGKKQVFVNQWATSYLTNNDPRLHIGLGNAKND